MEYERQQREYRQQQEQQRQEQQRLQQLQNDNARRQQEELSRINRPTTPATQSPQYPSMQGSGPSASPSTGKPSTAQNTATSERRYALPGHGYFVVDVPRDWKEQVRQPPDRSPPTIVLGPASGNSFQVLLTPLGPKRRVAHLIHAMKSVPQLSAGRRAPSLGRLNPTYGCEGSVEARAPVSISPQPTVPRSPVLTSS